MLKKKNNSTEQNLKILLALFMDWATSHLAVRKELHKGKDVDGRRGQDKEVISKEQCGEVTFL